jgi:hypothetical protein
MKITTIAISLLSVFAQTGCQPQSDLPDLPGVHSVEISQPVSRPTTRIIHILNRHYLPKDVFAADTHDVADQPPTDEEIDDQYERFLDDVEAVQREQVELLVAMIERNHLEAVFYEGVTSDFLTDFNQRIETLREFEKSKPTGNSPIEQLILSEYRADLLEVGAPGRLLISGKLKRILPADDAAMLEKSNPVTSAGVVLDRAAIETRENAMVKLMLDGRKTAVIVLGGAHDLSDNVPVDCEYIHVTTNQYRRVAIGGE